MAFYVGQKVERIGGEPSDTPQFDPPFKTELTVSAVWVAPWGVELINLVEYPFPKSHLHGWRARFFRPLTARSTDTGMKILRKLQDPANHKHREDA